MVYNWQKGSACHHRNGSQDCDVYFYLAIAAAVPLTHSSVYLLSSSLSVGDIEAFSVDRLLLATNQIVLGAGHCNHRVVTTDKEVAT